MMIQRNLKKALDAIRLKLNAKRNNNTQATDKPWTGAYRDSEGNWQWDERPVSTIEEIQAPMVGDMRASMGASMVVEDGVVKEINVTSVSLNAPGAAVDGGPSYVSIAPAQPLPFVETFDWDHITMDVYYGNLRDSEWTLVLYRLPHQGRWDVMVLRDDRHVTHMDHTFDADTIKLAKEYATDWAIRIKGITDRTTNIAMLRREE